MPVNFTGEVGPAMPESTLPGKRHCFYGYANPSQGFRLTWRIHCGWVGRHEQETRFSEDTDANREGRRLVLSGSGCEDASGPAPRFGGGGGEGDAISFSFPAILTSRLEF